MAMFGGYKHGFLIWIAHFLAFCGFGVLIGGLAALQAVSVLSQFPTVMERKGQQRACDGHLLVLAALATGVPLVCFWATC